MAQIKTFTCRFQPMLRTGMDHWVPMTEYLVPVSWWAYDDDRLGARGDAKLTKAQVKTLAHTANQARRNVRKEWGHYATVGTAVEITSG